jgi:hypothetical protein
MSHNGHVLKAWLSALLGGSRTSGAWGLVEVGSGGVALKWT